MKVKVGDLLEDAGDGDIGLVVGFSDRQWYGVPGRNAALVLWASLGSPVEMDIAVIDSGWVRIIGRK